MSKNTVLELPGQGVIVDPLTELLRKGAGRLIYRAVEAELEELLAEHSARRTEDGRSGVVRNGYHPERAIQTGVGPVTVRIFPAQHWQSIRTSNPIESTFGTIRHRTKRSKGCLSRDGMLHMMFKLGQCAERKWRRLRGFDYLAKVVIGIKFKDGIEVTALDQAAA